MLEQATAKHFYPELNIDLPEGSNGHKVIEELAANAKFEGATEIITIDGLRVGIPLTASA